MTVRAVAFDIGGVLERMEPADALLARWRSRLGLGPDEFDAAMARVDPGGLSATGGLSEAGYRQQLAAAFGLSPAQAGEFMAELWDWYCGELDEELTSYATSLRGRYLTAILSNSADGARREEQARYRFPDLFDLIIYSHEVGLAKPDPRAYQLLLDRLGVAPTELIFLDDLPENIDTARELGIQAILHHSTPESIDAISALIEG